MVNKHKKFVNGHKSEYEVMYMQANLAKNNEHFMVKNLNTG